MFKIAIGTRKTNGSSNTKQGNYSGKSSHCEVDNTLCRKSVLQIVRNASILLKNLKKIMDSTLCSDCRSLSRSLTFISFLCIALLSVTYAKNLPEQTCRPRPTVVAVHDSHGFKPYHVQLYRCSGTCKDTSPRHIACVAAREEEIKLNAVDPTTNQETTIKVTNHTACDCKCNVHCNMEVGEFRDDITCRCFNPDGPKFGGSKDNRTAMEETDRAVLPYKIGMAFVGFFALCVLVVDMIMCSKHMGVLHAVKKSCCTSGDKTDGQGTYNMNKVNGSPTKEKVVRL